MADNQKDAEEYNSNTNAPDMDEIGKYKMDYKEKSLCVIINMENFSKEKEETKNLTKREGTEKDKESLEKLWKDIGFTVLVLNDKKSDVIFRTLKKAAEEDHSQRSCFVCVVMSHGDEEGFYGFDEKIDLEKVMQKFNARNCKSLLGKPKLFFIQACRGDKRDDGVELHRGPVTQNAIQTEADFLCHYATPPGYASWRRRNTGSWFIQSLCEILEEHRKDYDLLHMLTLVNHKVAFNYENSNTKQKQIPYIVSKLTKLVYL